MRAGTEGAAETREARRRRALQIASSHGALPRLSSPTRTAGRRGLTGTPASTRELGAQHQHAQAQSQVHGLGAYDTGLDWERLTTRPAGLRLHSRRLGAAAATFPVRRPLVRCSDAAAATRMPLRAQSGPPRILNAAIARHRCTGHLTGFPCGPLFRSAASMSGAERSCFHILIGVRRYVVIKGQAVSGRQ
ncbi:hypothetical protein BD413DRAFT_222239 [Trametes elegans]|nr:hypothetical protein BD413DRAFT_222239 [Trametes elegans]